MKALKIWGWSLFAAFVILAGTDVFLLVGRSEASEWTMMLTIMSAVCLLLSITVFVCAQAIKQSKTDR
jgi:hypothetical protein